MRIAKIIDTKLSSCGKLVEVWPNRLNRYMVTVRFQCSDKMYTISKHAVEDVEDQQLIDKWIEIDNNKK